MPKKKAKNTIFGMSRTTFEMYLIQYGSILLLILTAALIYYFKTDIVTNLQNFIIDNPSFRN